MTNSAMPPTFQLAASGAGNNPGKVKSADASAKNKPVLSIGGVPADLLEKLYKFEGLKWEVYSDTLGNLTGGLGHLLTGDEIGKYSEGSPLTAAQIYAWAQKDVGEAWNAGQTQAARLGVKDHDFMVALASMSFQNGVYWYTEHVKTWALMTEHKWDEAAIEAADSDWARQTPSRLHDFQAALRKLANPSLKTSASNGPTIVKSSASPKLTTTSSEVLPGDIERIKQVQTKLKAIGLYNGTIDGKDKRSDGKESNTTKGIRKFQESQHLPSTGEVDEATWAALNKVESLSIWHRFMANLEKQQVEKKVDAPESAGLAAPFTKMAAEAKMKSAGAESSESVAETGNFVDKKYWRTQQTAKDGGQAGFISPMASPTACRYVSSEMLILYMKAEKPEILKELGVSGIGDLGFGTKKDVTENSADAGGFLRILQEDASKQTGGYTKNVQNPDAMVVNDQASQAIAYIDEKLSAGIPLVVGVDHTFNRGRNEDTTDHFITLTGMGKTAEGKKFYHFFDPARSQQSSGVDNNGKNRLVEESMGVYRAPQPTGSHDAQRYYLTTVIVFPADRKKFKKE